MENKNDFEFNYSAPTSEERKEIETIRRSYLNPAKKNESKLDYLRKLDNKVKNIPIIIALIVGIVGVLIFGLGMTMILEWNLIGWGIVVCILGIPPIAIANPLYNYYTRQMKEKYSEEIVKVSDELLNEDNKEL